MSEEVKIDFIERNQQHSDYDWANITVADDRVGKARCLIEKKRLIIYSINIYPEYSGKGYGRIFVEQAAEKWDEIVADRVRATAIGFWEKLGFVNNHDGNWIFRKK